MTPVFIVYNTQLVGGDEIPTGPADLIEPGSYECGIGTPHAAVGESSWTAVLVQRKTVGDHYWEALAAKDPNIYTSSSVLGQDLARGEVCIGPLPTPSTRNLIEEGAPLDFVFPVEGVPQYSSWAGVTRAGTNPAAGKAFLNWLTSSRGMSVAAAEGGRYVPRTGFDPPTYGDVQLPPLEEVDFLARDFVEEAEIREDWTQEWLDTFGYVPTD